MDILNLEENKLGYKQEELSMEKLRDTHTKYARNGRNEESSRTTS